MEVQIGIIGFEVGPMFLCLLHLVFTELALAGGEGFGNFFGWLAFADGDEVDVRCIAIPLLRGFIDV